VIANVVQVLQGVDGASTKVDGHTAAANVVWGADHEVVDSIAVHVSGTSDAGVGARESDFRDRVGRRAAEPDVHVILLGADQVREPVGIDVARVRRVHETLAGPGTGDREIGGRIERRPSEPDVDGAGIECGGIGVRSGGEHVRVSIPVHVPGAADHGAQLIILPEGREHAVRDRIGHGASEEHVRATGLVPAVCVLRCAHDHVVEAILVPSPADATEAPNAVSDPVDSPIQGEVRRGVERRPAVVDEGLALVPGVLRPDDEVLVAVAVEVTGRGDADAEPCDVAGRTRAR